MSFEPVHNLIEMDFDIMDENFSRYLVEDGSTLKVKVVVKKIFREANLNAQGYPRGIALDFTNAVAAIVPPILKRTPTAEPWDPNRDVGQEMKYIVQDERWQSYLTNEGFKILVKPVVTKIIKYNKYNSFGEPIYHATIQAITNIEKFISKPTSPTEDAR